MQTWTPSSSNLDLEVLHSNTHTCVTIIVEIVLFNIATDSHLGYCILRPCSLDFPKNNVGNEFLIPKKH